MPDLPMPKRLRAGRLEEPAPYLIRGHPDVVPTKVGNHLKDWGPVGIDSYRVFTGNPGFRLEFTHVLVGATLCGDPHPGYGAGMTILIEGVIYK